MRAKEFVKDWIIMPQSIKALGLIHKKGVGPNIRFEFKNKGNNRANEDGDSVARVLGKAEASLSHGLEMAQNIINKKYSMAEVQAETIVQNWPPLIDNIKNIYKTKEDAAGVGIITKQNTTKDVKPGDEYKNVKKLHLN